MLNLKKWFPKLLQEIIMERVCHISDRPIDHGRKDIIIIKLPSGMNSTLIVRDYQNTSGKIKKGIEKKQNGVCLQ